ncbi:MAG: threonine synthase [Bacteroidaceae bacterium]|nr:threonine synthase [Bacteroidaceae bacterium]
MMYYSTNRKAPQATLEKAVVKGLAEDRGLYMPERINQLPKEFFDDIASLAFQDVAYNVASAFFGEDVDLDALYDIVRSTLSFDCPLVRVTDDIYSLELFHGPTLAFKDVGARFMARMLGYFRCDEQINVLVATSGDTGSAVANGFLDVPGIHVYVLYPKGKVSPIQECQFTTLGRNITAVEVDGVFDDCQRLVKSAFMDEELNNHMHLTSANSINVARFLPQAFYYFWAYAQAVRLGLTQRKFVVSVPSGNFGNLCSALFGVRMGLPVHRFIAANNANDVFYNYLQTGRYEPRASMQTIANAMDVGAPSNMARILELYGNDHEAVCQHISGAAYDDEQIADAMRLCISDTGYVLDPHGACGYRALRESLQPGEFGIFLETAHPAKFKELVDKVLGIEIPVPDRLAAFMQGRKQSIPMSADFQDFRAFLMNV